MEKVYVITYENFAGGDYSSGLCYVLDTKEKAEIMLEEIKKDEICEYDGKQDIKNLIHNLITENGFIIDYGYGEEYTKYIIEEIEVN